MKKNKEVVDYSFFEKEIESITKDKNFKDTSIYIAHSDVSVFSHCYDVSKKSYEFALTHHIKCDLKSLIRGAFLHDYYLYDWHDKKNRLPHHGFRHNKYALANAKKDFSLNKVEENIIYSHMFPLTIFALPKYKEAWITCYIDKKVAKKESKLKHQQGYLAKAKPVV